MNSAKKLLDVLVDGLHLTVGHLLSLGAIAGFGVAWVWLRKQDEQVMFLGGAILVALAILLLVLWGVWCLWRQSPVVLHLPTGEKVYAARARDLRDAKKLGSAHVHIDGDLDAVVSLIGELNSIESQSAIQPFFRQHNIIDWKRGPQCLEIPEVYRAHNPGIGARESFGAFSTSTNIDIQKILDLLKRVVSHVKQTPGAVVEAEYVEALIDTRGRWRQVPTADQLVMQRIQHDLPTQIIWNYEVHFAFDIRTPKSTTIPISLETLLIETQAFLPVGGWFLFSEEEDSADFSLSRYRSNQFFSDFETPQKRTVEGQYRLLAGYLSRLSAEHGYTFTLRALVERVMGIYKQPSASEPETTLVDLNKIGMWEKDGNWKHFWVVAPNFAADLNKNIEEAMKENLKRGTKYTYFLQSKADVRRLERFVRQQLDPTASISVVLLSPFHLAEEIKANLVNGWFVGFIHGDIDPWSAEGYRLERDENREINSASLVSLEELKMLICELHPLIVGGKTQGLRVPLKKSQLLGKFALLCTDIRCSSALQDGVTEWEGLIDDYDAVISQATSRFGGYIGKELLDGFVLAVPEENALKCAIQIQKAAAEILSSQNKTNSHRIVVDWGPVYMRVPGTDLEGPQWSRCLEIVQKIPAGEIWLTDQFCTIIGSLLPSFSKNQHTEDVQEHTILSGSEPVVMRKLVIDSKWQ